MDRYRYFIFSQKRVLSLGILQIACGGLCVVCGFLDAVFRKDTPLSTSRAPLWGGLVRYGGSNPHLTDLYRKLWTIYFPSWFNKALHKIGKFLN